MARMIPAILPHSAPKSDEIIFNSIKKSGHTSAWVVFYQQDERPRFIISITQYYLVICLDVEGGPYHFRKGDWYNTDGTSISSSLGQGSKAVSGLEKRFSHPGSPLSFEYAMAFTDWIIPSGTKIPPGALMVTSPDAKDPDKLGSILNSHASFVGSSAPHGTSSGRDAMNDLFKLHDYLESKITGGKGLKTGPKAPKTGPKAPKTIPRADFADLEISRPQLLRLTADQVESLDIAEDNPRCTINGAAGTGKTVLAMELAKSRCEDGKTVALLCSNPNLIRHLEPWAKKISDDSSKGGKIVAGTPATLPSYIFKEKKDHDSLNRHQQKLVDSPKLENSLRFGYSYPAWSSFVDETVKDLGQGGFFDYLVVDEAQNLCDDDEIFLKLMDAMLKSGLAGGHFTMFGDFTYQTIVCHRPIKDGEDGRDVLKRFIKSRDLPSITLRKNCRNTHEIAKKVAELTDIPSLPLSGVHGPDVQIEYFTEEELQNKLNKLVKGLEKRQFRSSQIILLSSNDDGFVHTGSYGGWELFNINIRDSEEATFTDEEGVVNPQGTTSSHILRYSDIYDFQGLESEVAILVIPVTDDQVVIGGGVTLPLEEHLRKMLYTGMSRAKAMLIIVAHKSYKEYLELLTPLL